MGSVYNKKIEEHHETKVDLIRSNRVIALYVTSNDSWCGLINKRKEI